MVMCDTEPDGPDGVSGAGMGLDSAGFRLDADDAPLGALGALGQGLGVLGGLGHDADEALTCTSTSSYSIYKQRIDSMFDETRSLLSGYGYGTTTTTATKPPPPPPPPLPTRLEGPARVEAARRSRKGSNVVQARIEKMFAEMSTAGGRNGAGGSGQRFSVDYLGSVPLADKVTTLHGLQGPLKDLYFGYRVDRAHSGSDRPAPPTQPAPWQPGFLEISGNGLRVHHNLGDVQSKAGSQPDASQAGGQPGGQPGSQPGSQPGLGKLEQLNPFPRIAVWAAVQFVCRERQKGGNHEGGSQHGGNQQGGNQHGGNQQPMECAFLPLIADSNQGGVEKDTLFRELSPSEERVIRSMRSILGPSGGGDGDSEGHNAPMFAVVMRGVSRQLECHGFVCASSEDAIVMAANLYQALMASMRAAGSAAGGAVAAGEASAAAPAGPDRSANANTGSGTRLLAGRIARMHHENGIGRLSIAGSIAGSVCGDGNGHTTDTANSLSLSAESSSSHADRAPEDAASLAVRQHAKQASKPASLPRPKTSPPPQPKVPPPVPKRPPRKKKSSGSSTDGEDLIVLEDTGEPPRSTKASSVSSLRGGYRPKAGGGGGVVPLAGPVRSGHGHGHGHRRSSLIPASDTGPPTSGPAGGDILTKVAIPRSHSFLNANGPLTRYGRRPPTQRNATAGPTAATGGGGGGGGGIGGLGRPGGGGGGSPLGFNELFTEFRQQEGLDSLDDILGAIIDAEGMSFNDLKPIYKEFLLKLALTLTKDELYHRSKSIMRRQRKKQVGLAGRGRRRGIAYTAVYIKKAVRRSINKLRPSKRSPLGKLLFSGSAPPKAGKGAAKSAGHKKKCKRKSKPAPVAASSISSYPSSNFRMSRRPSISVSQALDAACNVNVNVSINNNNNNINRSNNKARLPRRRSSRRSSTRHHHQQPLLPSLQPPPLMTSTSEDSDFFTMIRCDSSRGGGRTGTTLGTQGGRSGLSGKGGGMNRSSSGYVSCSDCSYDSESCTCLSAERCYCSLSKYRPPPDALPVLPPPPLGAVPCACDTDSCQGSDKCYCPRGRQHDTRQSVRSARGPREDHNPARCSQRHRQRRGSVTPAVPPVDATSLATPLMAHGVAHGASHGVPPANIFEQLRQQGFAASDSSLSRAESPMTAWCKNESRVSHGAHRSGGRGGSGQGERRKQRASSSAGSMRSSRSLEFLQGPLLGHLQSLQSHVLPQHQYPAPGNLWDRERERLGERVNKIAKGSAKQNKSNKLSSSKSSSKASLLDGFGSARSRCPSRMDLYRSSSRSCSYIAGPVLEPPVVLRHSSGRPRTGSRPSSRAGSHADSWVCEDEDADEPVLDDTNEEVMLLLADESSSRRARQTRQGRQQRKVLVVSARDPTGRVIYMGASASASASAKMQGQGQSIKAGQFFPRASLSHTPGSSSRRQSRANLPRHNQHGQLTAKKSDSMASCASMAGEALSVKKSAEIAALFTGVKMSQTTDIVATARSTDVTDSRDSSTTTGDGEELLYSSLDGHSRGHSSGHGPGQRRQGLNQGLGQGAYLSHTTVGSSLENSLGYLP